MRITFHYNPVDKPLITYDENEENLMSPRIKSITELRREIAAKERQLKKFVSQRKKVAARLAVIEKRIELLGGEPPKPKRGRGRPKRRKKVARKKTRRAGRLARKVKKARRATGKPLVEYIRQVLAKSPKPMRAKNIVQAVRKVGYKTFSKDFYGIVAAALRDKKNFKRVGRGVYTLSK